MIPKTAAEILASAKLAPPKKTRKKRNHDLSALSDPSNLFEGSTTSTASSTAQLLSRFQSVTAFNRLDPQGTTDVQSLVEEEGVLDVSVDKEQSTSAILSIR